MRAFIGIPIPEEIRKPYYKVCKPLKDTADISFVKPEKMHITLAFFSDLNKNKLPLIENIFNDISLEAFEINCESIGQFRRRGIPSTIFIQIYSDMLLEYAKILHTKLDEAGIHFDKKPIVPHITLGRIKEMQNEIGYFKLYKDISKNFMKTSFFIEEVSLFSSNMTVYKKEISKYFQKESDV